MWVPKMYTFGGPIESTGFGMVYSLKVLVSHGRPSGMIRYKIRRLCETLCNF